MKKKLSPLPNRSITAFVLYVFLFFTLFNPILILAQQQPDCEDRLEEAKTKFYEEKSYQAVITLLEPCTGKELLGVVDEVAAYEWLGQSYLQLGDTLRAWNAGEQVLILWPEYSPDHPFGTKPAPESGPVELLPGFRNLMIRIIAEQEKPPGWGKRNRKYIIGGGILLAAGIAVLIWCPWCKGDPLPEPPAYPTTR